MMLGRVVASVTATVKIPDLKGRKVLLVEQTGPDGEGKGKHIVAVDTCNAGTGDLVLVIDEGGSARMLLEAPKVMTIRSVVAGVVDAVERVRGD